MKYFKSKTINFSALIGIFGVIQMTLPKVEEQLGGYYGFVFMGVAVVIAILRAVTNKPLSEK